MLYFVGTTHWFAASSLQRSLYSSFSNLFYHAYNVTILQLHYEQGFRTSQ